MDFSWTTVSSIAGIIWTDLALAGDNALIIGVATRKLPKKLRLAANVFGALAAIGLRILLVFFVVKLLQIPLIKAIGGLVLLWIAWRLAAPEKHEGNDVRAARGIWEATWIIACADLIMSLDNVIAIAAIASDTFWLVPFGIGFTIPIIIIGGRLITWILDKIPWLMALAAAYLAAVAAAMIVEDTWLRDNMHIGSLRYILQSTFVIFIIGRWFLRKYTSALH